MRCSSIRFLIINRIALSPSRKVIERRRTRAKFLTERRRIGKRVAAPCNPLRSTRNGRQRGRKEALRKSFTGSVLRRIFFPCWEWSRPWGAPRSEEHTSELQSRRDLVCRLLLEKKKNNNRT